MKKFDFILLIEIEEVYLLIYKALFRRIQPQAMLLIFDNGAQALPFLNQIHTELRLADQPPAVLVLFNVDMLYSDAPLFLEKCQMWNLFEDGQLQVVLLSVLWGPEQKKRFPTLPAHVYQGEKPLTEEQFFYLLNRPQGLEGS